MKKCSICQLEKELTEFYKDSYNKCGLDNRCKLCNSNRHKVWSENNKKHLDAYHENYRNTHKEEIKVTQKQSRKRHRKKINKYCRYRRKNDPIYRLTSNMRGRFRSWLRGNKKSRHTFEYINCTKEELFEHLEALFYDNPETGEKMTRENYGLWEVDHKYPLSRFDPTSEEDMYKAWKKENLQPMWAKDNRSKGNKIT